MCERRVEEVGGGMNVMTKLRPGGCRQLALGVPELNSFCSPGLYGTNTDAPSSFMKQVPRFTIDILLRTPGIPSPSISLDIATKASFFYTWACFVEGCTLQSRGLGSEERNRCGRGDTDWSNPRHTKR